MFFPKRTEKNIKQISRLFDVSLYICIFIVGLLGALFSLTVYYVCFLFTMQIMFYLDQLEIKNLEASSDKASKDNVSL